MGKLGRGLAVVGSAGKAIAAPDGQLPIVRADIRVPAAIPQKDLEMTAEYTLPPSIEKLSTGNTLVSTTLSVFSLRPKKNIDWPGSDARIGLVLKCMFALRMVE